MLKGTKNIITILVVMVVATLNVNAQSYINVSGGPTYAIHSEALSDTPGAKEGTFSEGIQAHLRYGKVVAGNLSVELGFIYSNSKELKVLDNANIGNSSTISASAQSTNYGLALTGRYDLGGPYVRAGVSTRFAGSTPNKIQASVPQLPTPNGLASAELSVERESTGKAPFGLIAGLGYQFAIADNIGLFVEGTYENIKIGSDKDKLNSGTAKVTIGPVTNEYNPAQFLDLVSQLQAGGVISAEQAAPFVALFDEEIDASNEAASPYSSIGVQVGFTVKF